MQRAFMPAFLSQKCDRISHPRARLTHTFSSKRHTPQLTRGAAHPHSFLQHGSNPTIKPISTAKFSRNVSTAVASGGNNEHLSADLQSNMRHAANFPYAFYKFTRPHTMLGTALSIISVSLLALPGWHFSDSAVLALWQALSAALLANISIVGLNQVFDVELDKINKPYLPLASGEISLNLGIGIVIATGIAAIAISLLSGSTPLLMTVVLSLVLGVLYSIELPFMRWKRYPFLAAVCILAVRAIFVQLGFFYHMKLAVSTAQLGLTPPLLFTLGFMLFFSIVIALFKDIPDVYGDDKLGIRTFSVRYGVPTIFWTCVALLLGAYAVGVGYGFSVENKLNGLIIMGGHTIAALLLFFVSKQVNLKKKQALVDHYMFVWKLFYAEYLFIPFFC